MEPLSKANLGKRKAGGSDQVAFASLVRVWPDRCVWPEIEMDVAEDDMPRYAKARDEIPFVVATLDGRHLGELEEGKDWARLFAKLRKSCC